jgi:pilus assembly protein CpaC
MVAAVCLVGADVAFAANARKDFYGAMGSNVINVEINKGTPVHLSAPAASVAIADPAIADVQVISPRLIMVAGRGVGETSVIAVDAMDNVILQGTVNVSHNLSRLARAMKDLTPARR